MATKAEKSNYRYSDFYCYMSLADFTAYIECDDLDTGNGFSITSSKLFAGGTPGR
ncbi:hypothetical protein QFZ23_002302 [Arthrobacter globiformis]|nr:hypothetical protein [Arthrobacter globiformis]